jgi:hypothetical protein
LIMRFLLLLALIGAVFWALRRSLGEQRQARLERLALPGTWRGEARDVLHLQGAATGGTLREQRADGSERRGHWRWAGETLEFRFDDGTTERLEVRVFGDQRLGLYGAGRKNQLFERVRSG